MPDPLTPALDRIRAFRASWNEGDLIDEESGMTAEDLDRIIQALEVGEKVVLVPRGPDVGR